MRWGAPGPGKWITVYAHPSDENGTGPRWHLAKVPPEGFAVRHPPGLWAGPVAHRISR